MNGAHTPIEEMELFRQYVQVANWVWKTVRQWDHLAVDTVGKQLIRAADSVGANLVEGDGRYSTADALHYFVVARASAREARYWLERAMDRALVSADECQEQVRRLAESTRVLNALIRYRRSRQGAKAVREAPASYVTSLVVQDEDPFTADLGIPDPTL